jgi:hypothetical protein
VDTKATEKMSAQRNEHIGNETNMRKEKKTEKEEYKTNELNNLGEVEDKEKELDTGLGKIRALLDNKKAILIENYEKKHDELRKELELRLKVEIHEIEERKNEHINDLMKNHEEAFKEMKDYYNNITKENLELIRMHREKLVDIRGQIEGNQGTIEKLKNEMLKLKEPLTKAI